MCLHVLALLDGAICPQGLSQLSHLSLYKHCTPGSHINTALVYWHATDTEDGNPGFNIRVDINTALVYYHATDTEHGNRRVTIAHLGVDINTALVYYHATDIVDGNRGVIS